MSPNPPLLPYELALPWVGSRFFLQNTKVLILGSHTSVKSTASMTDTEWIQKLRADLLQDPYYEILVHDIGMSMENFTDIVAITNWCGYFEKQPTSGEYTRQIDRLVRICAMLKLDAILGIGTTQDRQLGLLAQEAKVRHVSIPTTVGKNNINPKTAFKKGDAFAAWQFLNY